MRTDINEQVLLEGLARDDREATEAIYKQYFNMAQTLVLSNNGSYDDAKDIFQEAVIALYQNVKSGNFELKSQLKTYLYSICRHLWLKRLSQLQKFSSDIETLEEVVPVAEDVEAYDQRTTDFILMEKAMAHLGEPCKSLIESYYVHKKSMQEIAGNFGYTNADNAKNQKYKCLVRLKKIFFDQHKKNK